MPSTIVAAVRDRRYAQLVCVLDDTHLRLDDDSVVQFTGERYVCIQGDFWNTDVAVIFGGDAARAVEEASTEILDGWQPRRLIDLDSGTEIAFDLDLAVQVRVDGAGGRA